MLKTIFFTLVGSSSGYGVGKVLKLKKGYLFSFIIVGATLGFIRGYTGEDLVTNIQKREDILMMILLQTY